MTWTSIATYVTGQLITATIANQQWGGNISHIASMLANGTALSALSSGTELVDNPLTTKGDLWSYTGAAQARLAVGSNQQTLIADSAESTGLKWSNRVQMATGTYTGDAGLTKAITGVGFQPNLVEIWEQEGTPLTVIASQATKTDQDGTRALVNHYALNTASINPSWLTDHIVSLDADGFTVGDGSSTGGNQFNQSSITYTYVAFKF